MGQDECSNFQLGTKHRGAICGSDRSDANNEPVAEWRDILWDRNEFHVRKEVGKHARRSINERFVPLHPSLDHGLAISVLGDPKTEKAEVEFIDKGQDECSTFQLGAKHRGAICGSDRSDAGAR